MTRLTHRTYGNDEHTSREMPVTAHLIHMTRDGKPTWISAMDDDHLINTIRFFCRPLKEISGKLDDKVPERSTRAQHMYGTPEKVNPKQYQKAVVGTQCRIAPYVIEAVIRGLPAVRDILTEAFGRTGIDTEAPTPDKRAMGSLMFNDMKDAHQRFGDPNSLKRRLMSRASGTPLPERDESMDEPMESHSVVEEL